MSGDARLLLHHEQAQARAASQVLARRSQPHQAGTDNNQIVALHLSNQNSEAGRFIPNRGTGSGEKLLLLS
uniref:Uncharacterized protein n=1 Tax=Thermogemmatispora argillosa TaxID=2045280 RepID=A0A455T0B5_9CHLR|nr:hypothetical protein KTA_14870 [Thermogemmatispora argillosa]